MKPNLQQIHSMPNLLESITWDKATKDKEMVPFMIRYQNPTVYMIAYLKRVHDDAIVCGVFPASEAAFPIECHNGLFSLKENPQEFELFWIVD